MSHKYLVVGGSGFAGTRLCSKIIERGDTYIAIDRSPFDCDNHFTVDITAPDEVSAAIQKIGPVDCIFHLAAMSFVPDTVKDPIKAVDCNLSGTINLLSIFRDELPNARFIYISSSEVYGVPQYLPIDENHPVSPNNPYAITKLAADQYCKFFGAKYDLDIVRVRPFNHSGSGQRPDFVLPSFARQIAQIENGILTPTLRVGNLEAARDFSHVDDVVDAYLAIAEKGKTGEVYNVCSQRSYKIRDLLEQLMVKSESCINVEVDPKRFRPLDVPEICGSHDKLTRHVGFEPKHTIEELLDELLAYWRKNI